MLIVASRQEPLFDSVSVALVGEISKTRMYMSANKYAGALGPPRVQKFIIHVCPVGGVVGFRAGDSVLEQSRQYSFRSGRRHAGRQVVFSKVKYKHESRAGNTPSRGSTENAQLDKD
jgi:hypothetical protein